MTLSLYSTFLMAPYVLNQVCCESNRYLLKSMFSLESLGFVQHDWISASSIDVLSIDYNTIFPHQCKVSDISNFSGKTFQEIREAGVWKLTAGSLLQQCCAIIQQQL